MWRLKIAILLGLTACNGGGGGDDEVPPGGEMPPGGGAGPGENMGLLNGGIAADGTPLPMETTDELLEQIPPVAGEALAPDPELVGLWAWAKGDVECFLRFHPDGTYSAEFTNYQTQRQTQETGSWGAHGDHLLIHLDPIPNADRFAQRNYFWFIDRVPTEAGGVRMIWSALLLKQETRHVERISDDANAPMPFGRYWVSRNHWGIGGRANIALGLNGSVVYNYTSWNEADRVRDLAGSFDLTRDGRFSMSLPGLGEMACDLVAQQGLQMDRCDREIEGINRQRWVVMGKPFDGTAALGGYYRAPGSTLFLEQTGDETYAGRFVDHSPSQNPSGPVVDVTGRVRIVEEGDDAFFSFNVAGRPVLELDTGIDTFDMAATYDVLNAISRGSTAFRPGNFNLVATRDLPPPAELSGLWYHSIGDITTSHEWLYLAEDGTYLRFGTAVSEIGVYEVGEREARFDPLCGEPYARPYVREGDHVVFDEVGYHYHMNWLTPIVAARHAQALRLMTAANAEWRAAHPLGAVDRSGGASPLDPNPGRFLDGARVFQQQAIFAWTLPTGTLRFTAMPNGRIEYFISSPGEAAADVHEIFWGAYTVRNEQLEIHWDTGDVEPYRIILGGRAITGSQERCYFDSTFDSETSFTNFLAP